MPYKLRKAPNRELYWVVTIETGKKHSKDPIPKDKAKAQKRILEQALRGGADPSAFPDPKNTPPPSWWKAGSGRKLRGGNYFNDYIKPGIEFVIRNNLHWYAAMVAGGAWTEFMLNPNEENFAQMLRFPVWLMRAINYAKGMGIGILIYGIVDKILKKLIEEQGVVVEIQQDYPPIPAGSETAVFKSDIVDGMVLIDINNTARANGHYFTPEEVAAIQQMAVDNEREATHPLTNMPIVSLVPYVAHVAPAVQGQGKLKGGITLNEYKELCNKYVNFKLSFQEIYEQWHEFEALLTQQQKDYVDTRASRDGIVDLLTEKLDEMYSQINLPNFGSFGSAEAFNDMFTKITDDFHIVYKLISVKLNEKDYSGERVGFEPQQSRGKGKTAQRRISQLKNKLDRLKARGKQLQNFLERKGNREGLTIEQLYETPEGKELKKVEMNHRKLAKEFNYWVLIEKGQAEAIPEEEEVPEPTNTSARSSGLAAVRMLRKGEGKGGAACKPPYHDYSKGKASVFALTCIDPRYTYDAAYFLQNKKELHQDYDLFTLAGASVGASKKEWTKSFFDNLELGIKLHGIKEVWCFDHLDCGMYKATFGLKDDLDPKIHIDCMDKLKKLIKKKHPKLKFRSFLIDAKGHVSSV